jgi:hypothetical protein
MLAVKWKRGIHRSIRFNNDPDSIGWHRAFSIRQDDSARQSLGHRNIMNARSRLLFLHKFRNCLRGSGVVKKLSNLMPSAGCWGDCSASYRAYSFCWALHASSVCGGGVGASAFGGGTSASTSSPALTSSSALPRASQQARHRYNTSTWKHLYLLAGSLALLIWLRTRPHQGAPP